MAKTGLTIALQDTALGIPQQSNGNCMIVYGSTAVLESPNFVNGLALFTSYRDAQNDVAIGGSKEPEKPGNPHLLAIMKKFFEIAGTGAKLWVYSVAGAKDNFVEDNAALIQDAIVRTGSATFDNRPRIVGWVTDEDDTIAAEDATGYPSELAETVKEISTITDNLFKVGYRIANAYAVTVNEKILADSGKVATATNLATLNAPTVGIITTSSILNDEGQVLKDVGEYLGICAAISIQNSPGAVNRPASSLQAYFNAGRDGQVIEVGTLTSVLFESLGQTQAVFHRTRVQRSGRYYNDGATCNEPTMALSAIEYVRVANVVCDDAEYFFQGIINTNVPLESNGDASKLYLSSLEETFYNSYCAPRVSVGEVSEIRVTVTGDNFVGTKTLKVTIEILPSPTCREIYVYTYYVTSLE